ncbi:hypothetical protein F7731_06965 [Cytobacillus depressus]|uniref:Cell-wall binding lipoprotein n=1 Tax=Cytobacillus depressus TaxID=1602942 RepID=A0A6L3V8G8_9BACI|nr:YkyA family protein [Cytobacillus depressus]KAB2337727.1 hypothetical protein F7731_06965 [Cytobacillus depressus]
MSNKSSLLLVCMIVVFILSGCLNEQNPIEKVYEVLEKVVESEQAFEEQQEPLIELEKKEKKIYDQIISLGMKEFPEVSKLSDEATVIVDDRKKHILKEHESIKASEKEFRALTEIIDEIDEPEQKEKSQKLFDIMIERYAIYDDLFQHYSKALELDKQLYSMFKNKDINLMDIDEQITKINEVYGKIIEANERFNEKTKEYNDTKLSFYKESGLNVKWKE